MPDHIHLFCLPRAETSFGLRAWVDYWKSLVTRNRPSEWTKPVWQRGCWDTEMRTLEQYGAKWDYVYLNPLRANLVAEPGDWPFAGEMHVFEV